MKYCCCLELIGVSGSVAISNNSWNILLPWFWGKCMAIRHFWGNIFDEIHFTPHGQNTDLVVVLNLLHLLSPADCSPNSTSRIISTGICLLRNKVQSHLLCVPRDHNSSKAPHFRATWTVKKAPPVTRRCIVTLQAYPASTRTLSRFLVLYQLTCEILYHVKISLPHLNRFPETAQS